MTEWEEGLGTGLDLSFCAMEMEKASFSVR